MLVPSEEGTLRLQGEKGRKVLFLCLAGTWKISFKLAVAEADRFVVREHLDKFAVCFCEGSRCFLALKETLLSVREEGLELRDADASR